VFQELAPTHLQSGSLPPNLDKFYRLGAHIHAKKPRGHRESPALGALGRSGFNLFEGFHLLTA